MEYAEYAQQYLFDFLKDEFRNHPNLRISLISTTDQNGVLVRTETREYYFPTEWIDQKDFNQVQALANKIKDLL